MVIVVPARSCTVLTAPLLSATDIFSCAAAGVTDGEKAAALKSAAANANAPAGRDLKSIETLALLWARAIN
jgi:hypothetical protein